MPYELERYLQNDRTASGIAAGIEHAIEALHLQAGDLLPPVRAMAAELGVNPGTVASAYRRLAQRGLVRGRGRAGTRVVAAPRRERGAPVALPEGLCNLADGNPDTELLPDLRAAMHAIEPGPVLYGHVGISPALDQAVRPQFEADGVPAGGLVAVGGALDGLERVLLAHLRPGDRVALEDPAFPRLLALLRILGFDAVPVACDQSGPTSAGLRAALARHPRALVVTPRAQNPTGALLDDARAEELRALLEPHPEVVIVEDDHSALICDVPYTGLITEPHQSWAVIRSFGKALGPDLRLAVAAGDPATLAAVETRQSLGTGWVSTLLQEAAAWLLNDPATVTTVRTAAMLYTTRRQALVDELGQRGIRSEARSGINVWIPVVDESAVVTALRDRGYGVSGGQPYRLASGPGIRVTTSRLPSDEASALAAALVQALVQPAYAA